MSFAVIVRSESPVTYEWFFEGDLIEGATKDVLLLTNVSAANEGDYTVKVTNASGSVTSSPATLQLDINNNGIRDSWEIENFGNLSQSGEGDFDGDGLTNFQEFEQNSDPLTREVNQWIAASGDFNTPGNWSLGRVPGPSDAAVINSGTFTLPASGILQAGRVTVNVPYVAPPDADVNLEVTGFWVFNGSFTLAPGRRFTVAGATGRVTVAGNTTLGSAHLFVHQGARLSFTELTSYTLLNESVNWEVQGEGSELSFPKLASISGNSVPGAYLSLIARYGAGRIDLPLLAAISKPADGDSAFNSGVTFTVSHRATISAPSLTDFDDQDPYPHSSLTASELGVLHLPLLTAPKGVQMNLNALSHPENFASLVRTTSFQINEGKVEMSGLDTITGLTSISAINGGSLSFPNVTDYTLPAGQSVTWRAQDIGSKLIFPNLTAIIGGMTPDRYLTIQAHYGGTATFPTLASITKPSDADPYPNSGVSLNSNGAGSLISAPLLAIFKDNDPTPNSSLVAEGNGTIDLPLLTAPYGVQFNTNSLSRPDRLTSLERTRTFRINSGTVVMSNLNSLANLAEIYVVNGASLTFPKLTIYTQPPGVNVIWQAEGTNSQLIFPNLKSLIGGKTPDRYLSVRAYYGATLSLPLLTSIIKAGDPDPYPNSGVSLNAYGGGSLLTAPKLTAFRDDDPQPNSSLYSEGGGILDLPLLKAPKGVQMNVNAISHPERFTSLENTRSFRLNAGSVTMSSLTSIAGFHSVYVVNGASLTFPNAKSYQVLAGVGVVWQADGTGSRLAFPALQTITGAETPESRLHLRAYYGGEISFPSLISITNPDDGDFQPNTGIFWHASVSGSVISAPLLQTFRDADGQAISQIRAEANGLVVLTSLAQSGVQNVSLDGLTLPPAPRSHITSSLTASVIVGKPFSYQVTATNTPTGFAAAGLPDGLEIDPGTGIIAGTPTAVGTSSVTLTVTNAQGDTQGTLILTVNPEPPKPMTGLVYAGLINLNPTAASNAGVIRYDFTNTGGFTGKVTLGGTDFPIKGTIDKGGNIPVLTLGTGVSALRLVSTWAGNRIDCVLFNAEKNFSFSAIRRPYSAANLLPTEWRGAYTARLTLQQGSSNNPGLRGHGFVTLTVSNSGNLTYAGLLSDGTKISGGMPLAADFSIQIHLPLYSKGGSLTGSLMLGDLTDTDLTGDLKWFRPTVAGTVQFASGWPAGLPLQLAGSRYTPPKAAKGTAPAVLPLPELPAVDSDGNVRLTLSLVNATINKPLHLSPAGMVSTVAPLSSGELFSLKLTATSGLLTGTYRQNATGKSFTLNAVLLQKSKAAAGFALSPEEAGVLSLTPTP